MLTPNTIALRKLTRKMLVSALLVAIVGLTFASKGGGGDKKGAKDVPVKANFTPIRTTAGFTLKTGPSFTGSFTLGTVKTREYVSFNTLITYEKGNSIYVVPYRVKINTSMYLHNSGSNLQLLDLKISMHK
jgi:hypothetical protein